MCIDPFADFINRTYASLLAFVKKRTRRPDVAEDIVQTAYTRLFADGEFDPSRSDAGGYLRQQAKWLITDHFRQKASSVSIRAEPADDRSPDQAVETAETREMVRRAVGRLRSEYQSVMLAWLRGNTHEQTAEELRLPIRRVYMLFHYGKAELRGELAGRAL
jgi:RNA polymerase sigma factor (sigma-70 family)